MISKHALTCDFLINGRSQCIKHLFILLELAEYPCTHFLSTPLLDCDPEVEAINDGAPEGSYELVYEEPDLTGGVEGVDYGIVYGPDDTEVEEQ